MRPVKEMSVDDLFNEGILLDRDLEKIMKQVLDTSIPDPELMVLLSLGRRKHFRLVAIMDELDARKK